MDDLRQGVTQSGHETFEALERLRSAGTLKPRERELRVLSSYAILQAAYQREPAMTPADRRHAAIEGAAALILVAELLELEAKEV